MGGGIHHSSVCGCLEPESEGGRIILWTGRPDDAPLYRLRRWSGWRFPAGGRTPFSVKPPAEKVLHVDRLLIGRKQAGNNLEALQGYIWYDSDQVSTNYPNADEWHAIYKDNEPIPEGKIGVLRANWSTVQIRCPWHLHYAVGIQGSVARGPGGEEGTVGRAVGGMFSATIGEEQIALWGYVDDQQNGTGLRINAPIEINKQRGITGWVRAGQPIKFVGGVAVAVSGSAWSDPRPCGTDVIANGDY